MRTRATLLGLLVVLFGGAAHADRAKAAAAYKEGSAAFARGSFAEAGAAFETAFAEDPRAASIYNAALAWQSAHADARAADDFERAIAGGDLRADLLGNAKTQLAKLEETLGKVAIVGPAGSHYTVAHVSGAPPGNVHLAPGHYTVAATYDAGGAAEFAVDVALGAAARVDVAPPPPRSVAPVVVAAPPPPESPRSTGIVGRYTLPVGIGMASAGVVAAGVAIVLGIEAKSALNDFTQSGDTSQSDHDRAVSNRNTCNVLLIAGGVVGLAGVGAILTVHRVKVEAALGPGSFGVNGTF